MMKNNDTKILIGEILGIASLIAIIVAVILSWKFQFMHPDMTEFRLFIENPYPTIVGIVALIGFYISKMLRKYKEH